ncbi:ATP-binding protein [Pseudoalteromonas xiamenensis]|uniref:sensor histidine kinase n=1 Tax=Pseudoalteromonas xiamenensis TaxID=882626 RepID=UPI0027E49362|nr:ATP-binding protein [Pseudoalteromonas xiamenensis]WMN60600.1 ATP-binding protein [Pseudoalteromonas xiamenensis]
MEKELELIKRQLAREKAGRQRAEDLLETRSRMLYELNQQLSSTLESLKAHETQLVQQEKLASIGQLAAGVAHEINTPAGFTMCNLEVLQQYVLSLLNYQDSLKKSAGLVPSDVQALDARFNIDMLRKDIPDLLEETLEGMNRIAAIVRELRSFARQGEDEKQWVNIDHLLKETLHLAAGQIKYHVEVITDFSIKKDLYCSPGKLSQVFLNLILNAGQAIEGRGHLWVSTYETQDKVVITFRDDGIGMDEQITQKVFDAFFTTKPAGKGTGLGLSISMDIIHQHNGSIKVESTLGEGTMFLVELPIIEKREDDA